MFVSSLVLRALALALPYQSPFDRSTSSRLRVNGIWLFLGGHLYTVAELRTLNSELTHFLSELFFWKGLRGVSRRRLKIPNKPSPMVLKGTAPILGSSISPFHS